MKAKQSFLVSLLLVGATLFFTSTAQPISAQSALPSILTAEIEDTLAQEQESTQSASTSGRIASPSAEVQQRIQQKKDEDITETGSKQKSELVAYLDSKDPGPLSWNNFLQHAIRNAVSQGVPANVIVLVILFPLVAALIGASRHIIGLRGFGIYVPAVLSVALVSTGVVEGLLIFVAIVGTALLTRKYLKKTQISYLPRTALLLWTVSLGILGVLMAAPYFQLVTLMTVNIFPILILVLLSENFLDALQKTKPVDALALVIETLTLAFVSSLILQMEPIQKFAIGEPELLVIGIAFFNVLIGKFTGLRITELLRFRSIIEEE